MQSKEQQSLPSAAGKLWRRAPVWRFSLIAAITCTALSVVFLPSRNPTVAPAAPSAVSVSSSVTGATTPSNAGTGENVSGMPNEQTCQINNQRHFQPSQHYSGKVVAFMARPQAMAMLQQSQKQAGMLISPSYVNNQRVILGPINGDPARLGTVVVPQGMNLKVGDIVAYSTGEIDAGNPCHYIPSLINRIITTDAAVSPPVTGATTSSNQANPGDMQASAALQPQSLAPHERAPLSSGTQTSSSNTNVSNGERANSVPTEQSCSVKADPFPPVQHYAGRVVSFMMPPAALALLQRSQAQVGMLISPHYVANQRALVIPITGGARSLATVLVPQGMFVKPGDIVTYNTGRRDPVDPCRYIPNLIDQVIATGVRPNPGQK